MKVQEDRFKISIICLTIMKDSLKYTLLSLKRQITKSTFEVILVFDGIAQDVNKIATLIKKTDLPNVRLIINELGGISNGRNKGIDLSRGEIIIFIDDDVILLPDFVENHTKFHTRNKQSIGVGNKFQLILSTKDEKKRARYIVAVMYGIEKYNDRVYEDRYNRATRKVFFDDKYKHQRWYAVVGRNMSMPKALFADKQWFDINFKGWGCEDSEFAYRMSKENINIGYIAEAINIHIDHPVSGNNLENLNRNIYYFESKYPEDIEVALFRLFTFFGMSFDEILAIQTLHQNYKSNYSYKIFKH